LHDLHQWLIDHGFYYDFSGQAASAVKGGGIAPRYQIAITNPGVSDSRPPVITYRVKTIIGCGPVEIEGRALQQEQYTETLIPDGRGATVVANSESFRVLNISLIRRNFLARFKS
jgi:hypothetical protein